jgi:hypothetical protein
MDWIRPVSLLTITLTFSLIGCGGGGGGHGGASSLSSPTGAYAQFESERSQIERDGLPLDDSSQTQSAASRMSASQLAGFDNLLRNLISSGDEIRREDRGHSGVQDDHRFEAELASAQTALQIVDSEKQHRSEGLPIPAGPRPTADNSPQVECDGATPPPITKENSPLFSANDNPTAQQIDQGCHQFCQTQSPDGKYYVQDNKCFCPRHVECVRKSAG